MVFEAAKGSVTK